MPKQQCQSTEGKLKVTCSMLTSTGISCHCVCLFVCHKSVFYWND